MSTRAPTTDIISIAQQASPKVAGNIALPRAQLSALSSVVVRTRSSTYLSRSAPSRSPRRASRARIPTGAEVGGIGDADYLHVRAPRRQT